MEDDRDAAQPMTSLDHPIILHQYDVSPFVRKVKIILAIKGRAWAACTQPVIAPKPDLVALTGAYRRIPVMQIGADIFCDSDLIIRTLDRLFPDPPLHTAGRSALAFCLAPWFGALLTETAVPLIFRDGRKVDPAFARDREQVMGKPFLDPAGWQRAAPHAAETLRAQLGWIGDVLADGRPWLDGDKPGLMDAFAYPMIGFLREMQADLAVVDGNPRLRSWEERVRDLGEGRRTEISPAEAVAIARDAQPLGADPIVEDEPNELSAGDRVVVSALDYGRDPVEGVLVAATPQHVTIRRTDERAGDLNVHFPRFGFSVERAAGGH